MNISILVLSILLAFFTGCAEPPLSLIKAAQPHLGTVVEITVADKEKSDQSIHQAIEEAFGEIERIENLLSKFRANSDISRINSSPSGQKVKVSFETIELIEKSRRFGRLTDGAFDITVQSAPTEKPSFRKVRIDKRNQTVLLAKPGMVLDLGGLAKGYAVDKAVAILKKEGITSALVNAGGDIYALGRPRESEGWQIALQHPRQPKAVLTVLEIENKAVATSGDYQRYVKIDGQRHSHIINPHTGEACADVPASVTVLAADCLTADALATSVFVLGPQEGISLVNRLKGTEAIVVGAEEDELDILLSRGLEEKIEFNYE